jgi:hypothetical protein
MSRLSKQSESFFGNDVFFDIEAKRTRSIVGKFISKRSEHVYIKEFKKRSEANTFDSSKIDFEAKRTCLFLMNLKIEANRTISIVGKSISKRSEHVYIKELKNRNEAKVVNIKL